LVGQMVEVIYLLSKHFKEEEGTLHAKTIISHYEF